MKFYNNIPKDSKATGAMIYVYRETLIGKYLPATWSGEVEKGESVVYSPSKTNCTYRALVIVGYGFGKVENREVTGLSATGQFIRIMGGEPWELRLETGRD